jgi:hypothetical protein
MALIPWHLLGEPALVVTVFGLLAAVAVAVRWTTAREVKAGRDAWVITQLPEVAQHEILCARRERDKERARAERAELELEDIRDARSTTLAGRASPRSFA